MKRLLLSLLVLIPATVLAQGQLQLRYAAEGMNDVESVERVHAQRQSILKSAFNNVPSDAIDQITVALYGTDHKIVESKLAWLMKDGSVQSLTDQKTISFEASGGSYFVVLTQQSHLPLISKAVELNGQLLDMTEPESLKAGCFASDNGQAAAYAGNVSDNDFEQNSFINAMDYFWVSYYQSNSETATNGYPKGDVNLDGQVNETDLAIVERNANMIRSASFQPIH